MPSLIKVIYDYAHCLQKYRPRYPYFAWKACRSWANQLKSDPRAADAWLAEISGQGKGSDVSVMLYMSGTTGQPKGDAYP